MLNSISIVGRLGTDPEAKYFDSGKNKAFVNVATDRPGKDGKTDWHRVEIWGKSAESFTEHAKKGDVIGFTGSLEYNEFEKDGQKVKLAIINAQSWRFCGGKKAAQEGQEGGGNGRRASQAPDDDGIPF